MQSDAPHAPAPARRAARRLVLVLLLGTLHPGAALARACLAEEPADYRLSDFRATTPCTLAGARVASTREARALAGKRSAVLVDVLPSPRRPKSLADDGFWAPVPRDNIPGSVWLPNTGFGKPPIEEERYLRDNLERLTAGDRSRTVVFYCEARCWMSWNAARRAVSWGYTGVVWYPEGTDGWRDAGLPLAAARPEPRGADH